MGLAIFRMGKEFTRGDRILFYFSYLYLALVAVVFVAGTLYMLSSDISDSSWSTFWLGYSIVMLTLTIIITIWVAIGGMKNLREMFATLETLERNEADARSSVIAPSPMFVTMQETVSDHVAPPKPGDRNRPRCSRHLLCTEGARA